MNSRLLLVGLLIAVCFSASCGKHEGGLEDELQRLNELRTDKGYEDEMERATERITAAGYPVKDLVAAYTNPSSSVHAADVLGQALQARSYDFSQLDWIALMRQHSPMSANGRLRYRNHFLPSGEEPVASFLAEYIVSDAPRDDRTAALRLALGRYPGLRSRLEAGSSAKIVQELLQ